MESDGLSRKRERESVRAVIAAAVKARAAAELKAARDAKGAEALGALARAPAKEREKLKAMKKAESPEEQQANKDKRLAKLVSPIVVRSMSRYAKSLEHEVFKKHAKEVYLSILTLIRSTSDYHRS